MNCIERYILILILIISCPEINAQTIDQKSSNIVFLLDISNSMGRDNKMTLLKKSTEELCKVLNPKDRISLFTFGTTVEMLYSTSSYPGPDSLIKTLSKIRSTASATNVNRGIYDAYEWCEKFRQPERNHVLLITDGEFALSPFTKEMVKTKNTIVLTCVVIGKGPSADSAVKYVTQELKLKVITLVNEEEDVKKLAELIKMEMIDNQEVRKKIQGT